MHRLFAVVFLPLVLVAPAVRADVHNFDDWVAATRLGVMLERTETAVRFVIHASSVWDEGLPSWQARLGRHTFCDDLRRDYPKLARYTYYIKLVRTLAPNESIMAFPATYERSGSGTAAECRPPVFRPGG